jgi:hypothetical protein
MTESSPATASRRLACPRCGTAFECSQSDDCWCAAEPYKLPVTSAEDCFCPTCLRRAAAEQEAARRKPR